MMTSCATSQEAVELRFGRCVAAQLTAGSEQLPQAVEGRLQVARQLALEVRRQPPQFGAAVSTVLSGTIHKTNITGRWQTRLGLWIPLMALAAGIITTCVRQELPANDLAESASALINRTSPSTVNSGSEQVMKVDD